MAFFNSPICFSLRAVVRGAYAECGVLGVQAQTAAPAWPAKPVKLIVNFTAGGPIDTLNLHPERLTGPGAVKRLTALSERYGRVIRVTGMKVE